MFRGALYPGNEQLRAAIVRTFLEVWVPFDTGVRLMAMLRSVMTDDAALGLIRDLLTREVFGPITEILSVADAELRAPLVGSQFVGLAAMRYVGGPEPLASASVDELVAAIGPTVQPYPTADLAAIAASPAI